MRLKDKIGHGHPLQAVWCGSPINTTLDTHFFTSSTDSGSLRDVARSKATVSSAVASVRMSGVYPTRIPLEFKRSSQIFCVLSHKALTWLVLWYSSFLQHRCSLSINCLVHRPVGQWHAFKPQPLIFLGESCSGKRRFSTEKPLGNSKGRLYRAGVIISPSTTTLFSFLPVGIRCSLPLRITFKKMWVLPLFYFLNGKMVISHGQRTDYFQGWSWKRWRPRAQNKRSLSGRQLVLK